MNKGVLLLLGAIGVGILANRDHRTVVEKGTSAVGGVTTHGSDIVASPYVHGFDSSWNPLIGAPAPSEYGQSPSANDWFEAQIAQQAPQAAPIGPLFDASNARALSSNPDWASYFQGYTQLSGGRIGAPIGNPFKNAAIGSMVAGVQIENSNQRSHLIHAWDDKFRYQNWGRYQ